MTAKIRLLKAEEIDVRVGTVSKSGSHKASFLLYKDARCDMAIMDEVFGPMNWKREHEVVNGNLFCKVSVYNPEIKEWVSKQDVGTESNTEREKGESSDSFKRACVNWGIGRELYTAPQIWINLTEREWNNNKPYVKFSVAHIEYDEETREIVDIVITDKDLNVRFSMKPNVWIRKVSECKSKAELNELWNQAPNDIKNIGSEFYNAVKRQGTKLTD